LFVKVCDAVAFAHAHGVIHRDLKPQNIMVGEFGEALVLDWGVAKRIADAGPPGQRKEPAAPAVPVRPVVTRDGAVIGTPAWMAPEQARGEVARIDARTDVYALGAILFYVLARRPPFCPGPGEEILRQVVEQAPPALRAIDPSIPRPLAAIVSRAMAKTSADRYRGAAELSADVLRFLDGGAVDAYSESILERGARVFARIRTLVALVAAYIVMRLLVLWMTGR
jgi:serine/threonine protein kinase